MVRLQVADGDTYLDGERVAAPSATPTAVSMWVAMESAWAIAEPPRGIIQTWSGEETRNQFQELGLRVNQELCLSVNHNYPFNCLELAHDRIFRGNVRHQTGH